jgi:hypothetical protein
MQTGSVCLPTTKEDLRVSSPRTVSPEEVMEKEVTVTSYVPEGHSLVDSM